MRKGKEKMNFIWFVVCDARSTIGELNQITLRVILFKPLPSPVPSKPLNRFSLKSEFQCLQWEIQFKPKVYC